MAVAIIVCGPESCGNKMLKNIFVANNFIDVSECTYEAQVVLPTNKEDIVWLRSCPHDKKWPDLLLMTSLLLSKGYSIKVLVPVRDTYSAACSQVRAGHASSVLHSIIKINNAISFITTQLALCKVPWSLFNYDSFVRHPEQMLESTLGLLQIYKRIVIPFEIINANDKYIFV